MVSGNNNGNKNGVAEVENGHEVKPHVDIANGHANANGNGAEAKKDNIVSNGNGFRYNEYDGKV